MAGEIAETWLRLVDWHWWCEVTRRCGGAPDRCAVIVKEAAGPTGPEAIDAPNPRAGVEFLAVHRLADGLTVCEAA